MSWILGVNPISQILAGGLVLGAFFMATDYSTSPVTKKGKVIFAIGCGLLTIVIRLYGPICGRRFLCDPADEHFNALD